MLNDFCEGFGNNTKAIFEVRKSRNRLRQAMESRISSLLSIWHLLVGDPDLRSSENRLLNAVCIFSFLGITACVLFNFLIGLNTLAGLLSCFLVLQTFIFYLSRIAGKTIPAIIVYAIASYLFLACNYFYNNGLNGPTFLAFLLSFHFLVQITPDRINWVWIPGHIIVVAILSLAEYFRPDLITSGYPDKISKFIDVDFTFFVLVTITYFLHKSIKVKYLAEKKKVSEQAALIQEKNIQLQFVDKERNRLFSIVSHDLRSPLNTIQAYLELLQETGLPETERKTMEKQLLSLTGQTKEMLTNLLSWSKSQLEHTSIKLEPLAVWATLKNTIEVIGAVASGKQIVVKTDIPGHLCFMADKDMIELVTRNLLSNAVKFTSTYGQVTISAQQIGSMVELSVSDNGAGMSEAQQEAIFTSEIKPTTGTDNEKGMGLGLLMCKEFVEAQSGTIRFASQEGQGTTFTVSLPVA